MGAWTTTYRRGLTGVPGSPTGYAIRAFKAELAFNGYGDGLVLDGLTFGETMSRQVRAYQLANGLAVDGVIGPLTSSALYARRFTTLQTNYGIPDNLVCKTCSLESAVDPGAVGVADPADHGIMQINATAHPEITLEEAFTATFALDYFARAITAMHTKLGDWDCAVAAWNVGGGGASDWCALHKPSTGGPRWFPDLFARATHYVELVRSQAC